MLATLCRTTTLEAADVLGAITLFIGLAHVAVDEGVGGQGLATAFAGLAARMLVGFLTVRLGDDLAALLELTTREGAKPRLGFSVKRISGREVGCVDFGLFSGADEASNLALHRRSGGFGCFRHGRLLGGSRTSPRGCFSLVHGAWQRIAEFGCQVQGMYWRFTLNNTTFFILALFSSADVNAGDVEGGVELALIVLHLSEPFGDIWARAAIFSFSMSIRSEI